MATNGEQSFSRVVIGMAKEDPDLEDYIRIRIGCEYEIELIGAKRVSLLAQFDQAAIRQRLSEGYKMTPRDTATAIAHCLLNVVDRPDLQVGFGDE